MYKKIEVFINKVINNNNKDARKNKVSDIREQEFDSLFIIGSVSIQWLPFLWQT